MTVPIAAITIETRRLCLRPLLDADVMDLFEIHSDRQTMRYWSTPPWTDPAEGLRLVERDRQGFRDGTAIRLGLEDRETQKMRSDWDTMRRPRQSGQTIR